jgi:hypothetical protein
MRFMMIVKASKESEAGALPSKKLVAAMGKFNEEMIKAGVMLSGEGLHPSSKGARIAYSGQKRTVTDGPFSQTGELIAGFWVIKVKSRQEAMEWASRVPFTNGEVVEVRQIFEASDFPPEILPPDAAAREQAWRDAQQRKGAS